MIFKQPKWSSILCIILSCTTFLPCLHHPYYLSYNNKVEISERVSLYIKECYSRRFNMSLYLTICMSLYPLNYLIALFHGYNNPAIETAVYLILSLTTKSLCVIACTDAHVDVLRKVEKEFERKLNEARR